MRRWALRILIAIAVVLALAAVAAQIVLATDVPRRAAVSALAEQTGLRFSASALRTGWRGRTELHDLTVTLPLERDPFVVVPVMRIRHTDLIRLALFRDIEINEAELEQPRVILRQDAAGTWNVVRAAAIMEDTRAQRGVAPGPPPDLPRLSIRDARLEVERPDRVIAYAPITIEGSPASPAWQFEALLAAERIVEGDLAPRGRWPHRVNVTLERAAPLLEPWQDELLADDAPIPPNLALIASWDGRLTATEDGVTGRLTIDRIVAGEMRGDGAADITIAGPALAIAPAGLRLDTGHPDLQTLQLRSGRIELVSDRMRFIRLLLDAPGPGVFAQVDGEWDGPDQRGRADVRWSGAFAPWRAQHEGAANLTIAAPGVGRRAIDGTIFTQGSIPQARWDAEIQIAGFGRTWEDLAGRITAQRFDIVTAEEGYDFSGFAARFMRSDREVHLTHIDMPAAPAAPGAPAPVFRARGALNLDTLAWSADFAATNWTPPMELDPFSVLAFGGWPIDVRLLATGGAQHVDLDTFTVRAPDGSLALKGWYRANDPSPVALTAAIDANVPDASETLTGRLHADLALTGYVDPLHLLIDGRMVSTHLAWEGRAMDEIAMDLRGRIDPHRAEFESDQFHLVGGSWRLAGGYDRRDHEALLTLDGETARIEQLIALAAPEPIDAAGVVSASVDVRIPDLDFSRVEVDGSWIVEDLRGLVFHADRGTGAISIRGEEALFTEMRFEHGGGEMLGTARLSLDDLQRIAIDVVTTQWPVRIPAIELETAVSGEAVLDLDLLDVTARGDVALIGDGRLAGQEFGNFEIDASIDGRRLTLNSLAARGVGGTLHGSGTLFLSPEQWVNSFADFDWQDVDLAQLALYSERLAPFRGKSSGALTVRRSVDPRAHEPMRIDLRAIMSEAMYDAIEIESVAMEAYLGPQRFMIQRAAAGVAGGEAQAWGRVTRHDGEPFVHLYLDLRDADLQQFADFMHFNDAPMPGRVTGWGSLGGYVRPPHRLFGEANLTLEDSDIVSLPGIRHVYSLLRVDFLTPRPTGRGEATVRLEGNAMEISRLTYFNRGADVIARLRIENIWKQRESPINGLAAGVIRPLRDLELPLVGRMDRLIGAIQANAASVQVSGTLAEPQTRLVPFGEITGALSRILRGTVGG